MIYAKLNLNLISKYLDFQCKRSETFANNFGLGIDIVSNSQSYRTWYLSMWNNFILQRVSTFFRFVSTSIPSFQAYADQRNPLFTTILLDDSTHHLNQKSSWVSRCISCDTLKCQSVHTLKAILYGRETWY